MTAFGARRTKEHCTHISLLSAIAFADVDSPFPFSPVFLL